MMQPPAVPPRPDGPRKAALHMRKGETIHRIATTDWAEHKGSRLCWRVVSKRRLDGRIEAMHFIAQAQANDLVTAHVVLPEAKFGDFIAKVEEAIQQFVPGLRLRAGEFTEFDQVEFGPYFIHDPEAEERLRKKGLMPPPPDAGQK